MLISFIEEPYPKVFLVADNESETRFCKFKMANSHRVFVCYRYISDVCLIY